MSDETRARADGGDAQGTATITCPRCGVEKPAGGYAPPGWLATPPGSTVLPTVGMARKAAAGEAGDHGDGELCACGQRRLGGDSA